MVTMQKDNRQIRIHDDMVGKYLDDGYSQIDGSGKVVKDPTGGKSFSAKEVQELKDKVDAKEALKAELQAKNSELEKEISVLKEKNSELEKALAALKTKTIKD